MTTRDVITRELAEDVAAMRLAKTILHSLAMKALELASEPEALGEWVRHNTQPVREAWAALDTRLR